jgi:multicomponent Na+:H+ antiporter subunit G
MATALLIVSAFLTLFGAVVVLMAMVGMVRFPDVFCRAHALGKGMTFGLLLLLAGLWVDLGREAVGLKIVAAIFFQFLTLPVASHLMARLAYRKRLPRAGVTEVHPPPETGNGNGA